MDKVIIALCIILIGWAIYTVIRSIYNQSKGRCSGKCSQCGKNGHCVMQPTEERIEEGEDKDKTSEP